MAVIYGLVLKSDLTQVRYVGRTKGKPENRFLAHKNDAMNGSDLPVHRWMRKYEDTTFIVLEDNLSIEDYVDRETYYIEKLKKDGHKLLNCTETGENGAVTFSAETRTKISKSLAGNSKAAAAAKLSWEKRKAKTVKSVEDLASFRKAKNQEDQLALLYSRVSTSMQVQDGVSLDVQERALKQAAELAGYTLTELVKEEGRSGKSISGRPALKKTLNRLASGEADALFVTRLDRLSRSTQDFLSIIDHSQKYGWRLVLLDLNLDTSSYQSRFVVTIMSALAEMERSIISERQKDVHSDRRSRGKVWGVDLGPKKRVPEEVLNRICSEYAAGESMHGIARSLNAEGIPAAYGGKWSASSINYFLVKNKITKVR